MRLEVTSPEGLGEVTEGTDLAAWLAPALDLRDGDVVVVTSKVVSKAEGRVRPGDRETALAGETARVVARRGPTTIVRHPLGLTMAAAGIDASNVAAGHIALLPADPDHSARRIRAGLRSLTGANVGVVVTDTAGRAWREGQTDIAIGCAGLRPLEEYAGRLDGYGNELAVTAPAVADEIASAAELAQGKLAGRPCAVLRGRADLVLGPDDDGPGATALVRPEGGDLFGFGSREAVLRALAGDPRDQEVFGSPVPADELEDVLGRVAAGTERRPDGSFRVPHPAARAVVEAVVFAHGWVVASYEPGPEAAEVRLRALDT